MQTPTAVTAAGLLSLSSFAALASAPTLDELAEIVAQQQEQIEQLANQEQRTATHIGGYGELHFNMVKDADDEIDFHRFVVYVGHDFSDSLRFRSEIELEHALSGDGKPGEVELEQAYIELDLAPNRFARAGVMLVPVGFLNATHEPNTFYGVERNRVENRIIPTTWWEAGVAVAGRNTAGLAWELMLHSGLGADAAADSDGFIRSGRQKVAEATANDLAATAHVSYAISSGVTVAATLQYQSDLSQQANDGLDEGILFETHADLQFGAFGLRALAAGWSIEGENAEATGRDQPFGYYIEPSWKVNDALGFFARLEQVEVQQDAAEDIITIGANYWLHPQVVLKADAQRLEKGDAETESVNLGIGYQF